MQMLFIISFKVNLKENLLDKLFYYKNKKKKFHGKLPKLIIILIYLLFALFMNKLRYIIIILEL